MTYTTRSTFFNNRLTKVTSIPNYATQWYSLRHNSNKATIQNNGKECIPIETIQLLSATTNDSIQTEFANAIRPYFLHQRPVLIKNYYQSFTPALQHWTRREYLLEKVGASTHCSVEIGGSYSDLSIDRPEITFGDFLHYMNLWEERHDLKGEDPRKEELVYMAQNDLNSLGDLVNDISFPEVTTDPKYDVGHGSAYNAMFWFGPRSCVSPLHYDPLDNLLVQIVGQKRVLLYPNRITERGDTIKDEDDHALNWHYAGYDGQQYNTSPIDVENPDFTQFGLFRHAPAAVECLISPGDILYVPSKWWHHVRSLDTAISVNIWWR